MPIVLREATRCSHCNHRMGYLYAKKGFGVRQSGHEKRCERRLRKTGSMLEDEAEVGAPVAAEAAPCEAVLCLALVDDIEAKQLEPTLEAATSECSGEGNTSTAAPGGRDEQRQQSLASEDEEAKEADPSPSSLQVEHSNRQLADVCTESTSSATEELALAAEAERAAAAELARILKEQEEGAVEADKKEIAAVQTVIDEHQQEKREEQARETHNLEQEGAPASSSDGAEVAHKEVAAEEREQAEDDEPQHQDEQQSDEQPQPQEENCENKAEDQEAALVETGVQEVQEEARTATSVVASLIALLRCERRMR